MSEDPRDLLTEAAPRPAHPVDLGRVVTTARHRQVRTRTLAAAASVLVVAALVVGVTSLSSGGTSSVAVRAGTPTTSDTPAGWTRVTVEGAGISIAIPPGWHRIAPEAGTSDLLVVGSAARVSEATALACGSGGNYPADIVGSWVWLEENPAGTPSEPRPADFSTFGTHCAPAGNSSADAYIMIPFTDAGRVFTARIGTVEAADPAAEIHFAEQVLNTLRVERLNDATTSTTAPATTTLPGVPTSVTPKIVGTNGGDSFNATTTDQQQIQQAFLGWLNGKTLDEAARWIEDFASIRDSEAQGFAQHTPEDVALFSGRVESVVVADPTHADVVYTLLHGGAPLYANLPGKAVKVDGKWLVTRDTACGLLSMGGITCPARTTPAP
jgi:hypothetical protein